MTPLHPSTPMSQEISIPPDAQNGDYVRIDGRPYRIVDGRPVALHPEVDVEALQSTVGTPFSPSGDAAGPRNASPDVPQPSDDDVQESDPSTTIDRPTAVGTGSASTDFSSSSISDLRHMAREAGVDITGLRSKTAIARALQRFHAGPLASDEESE